MSLLDLAKEAAAAYHAANDGNATPEQAAELRVLVPEVCRLVGEADAARALAIALADPADALTCYRALAAKLAPRRSGAEGWPWLAEETR